MSLAKLIFCDRFCYEKYNNIVPLYLQVFRCMHIVFKAYINNLWTSCGLRTIVTIMFWSVKL